MNSLLMSTHHLAKGLNGALDFICAGEGRRSGEQETGKTWGRQRRSRMVTYITLHTQAARAPRAAELTSLL